MVAGLLVKASRSWPLWKLPLIDTLVLARVLLSKSVTVKPLSTTMGVLVTLLPSVKAVWPPEALVTGVSFTAVTETTLVPAVLLELPSLTTKLTVRLLVLGELELSVYVTERKAACHCATVAVAPAELRKSWPLPAL